MRNKETGEFELLVGDRQLLSALVIVVLLLGVVFCMGYVVGQNSPRLSKSQAEATPTPAAALDQRPQAAAPAVVPPPSIAEPTPTPQQAAPDAGQAPAEAPAQPVTQPARETAAPAARPEPAKPAPAKVAAPRAEAPKAEKPRAEGQPAPGSYWQVGAFKREADAQTIQLNLKHGGMPAVVINGADGLSRVLVGPYANNDAAALSTAKADLESKFGIRSPVRVRR
jgi:cell division septation protein DedD